MKLLWLIFLVGFAPVVGQKVQRVSAEVQYGFIIAHAADLKPVSNHYPVSFIVNWQAMKTTQESWQVSNSFHYLGLQLAYVDFGDPKVLGKAFALIGTFEPLLWRTNNLALTLRTGLGLSYLTKTHHAENNPLNNFFSTPFSFLLYVSPAIEYQLSPQLSGRLSFNYNHISNGGQKQPNRGMNFPQAGIGLNYYLQKVQPLPAYERKTPDKNWRFDMETGITSNKTNSGNERKPVISLSGWASKPIGALNALGTGLEFSNDWSGPKGATISLAPFVSHHFLLGRMDFSQRMAVLIHKPSYNPHRFYQRYVLYYKTSRPLMIGCSLKAYGHIADEMDIRLGWRF